MMESPKSLGKNQRILNHLVYVRKGRGQLVPGKITKVGVEANDDKVEITLGTSKQRERIILDLNDPDLIFRHLRKRKQTAKNRGIN